MACCTLQTLGVHLGKTEPACTEALLQISLPSFFSQVVNSYDMAAGLPGRPWKDVHTGDLELTQG